MVRRSGDSIPVVRRSEGLLESSDRPLTAIAGPSGLVCATASSSGRSRSGWTGPVLLVPPITPYVVSSGCPVSGSSKPPEPSRLLNVGDNRVGRVPKLGTRPIITV